MSMDQTQVVGLSATLAVVLGGTLYFAFKGQSKGKSIGGSSAGTAAASMGDPSNGDEWEMLGAFGHELEHHGHFCKDYAPGCLQRNRGDGTCCPSLTGGIELETSLSNDNSCCGTNVRLALKNTQGHGVGFIDCHEAAFLGPLVECGAIQVSARIGRLVHPIGGKPPIMVYVKGKVPWLEAHKTDPNWQTAILTMVKKLGEIDNEWLKAEDDEINMEAIQRIRPPATVRPRKCTCIAESCWLLGGGGHVCAIPGGRGCSMTLEAGAPPVLVRFSALVGTQDWAGAVRLADEVDAALKDVQPEMRAVALQGLAFALIQAPEGSGQDSRRATALLKEAEGMFAACGDVEGQSVTWNSLEAVLAKFGRLAEAATWTTKLLDLGDVWGDPAMVGEHACFIGEKLVRVGGDRNCALAVPLLERALRASASPALAGQPKAAEFRMKALSYLATALMDLGSFDQALEYSSLSVADMEVLGDAGGIAGALRTRAMIHDKRGAKADACADLEALLAVAVPGCSGLPEETRAALVDEATQILARLRAEASP